MDEERLLWAQIHRHDQRIEKHQDSIQQYEMEKQMQKKGTQKRKQTQQHSGTKRMKVYMLLFCAVYMFQLDGCIKRQ